MKRKISFLLVFAMLVSILSVQTIALAVVYQETCYEAEDAARSGVSVYQRVKYL